MGAGLVKLAYVNWSKLPDRALRVLCFMAVTVPDRNDPPVYFGGRKSIALSGLGRRLPPVEDRSEEAQKLRASIYQDVKKQIRILTDAKAIERLNDPGGKDAETAQYLLRVRDRQPGDNSADDDPPED